MGEEFALFHIHIGKFNYSFNYFCCCQNNGLKHSLIIHIHEHLARGSNPTVTKFLVRLALVRHLQQNDDKRGKTHTRSIHTVHEESSHRLPSR